MKLALEIGSNCHGGHCPAIYKTDRGTVVVQGSLVSPREACVDIAAHEALVEIPLHLLAEYAGRSTGH